MKNVNHHTLEKRQAAIIGIPHLRETWLQNMSFDIEDPVLYHRAEPTSRVNQLFQPLARNKERHLLLWNDQLSNGSFPPNTCLFHYVVIIAEKSIH